MHSENENAPEERKRILALDGGGVRGVFSIEILSRMESLLRDRLEKPRLVLADHFHFMAGTSTGAIIATLLSWGEPMDKIRELYHARCEEIFPKMVPWKVWQWQRFTRALYSSESLSVFLRNFFFDENTGQTAELGTKKLKNTLLLCMRNGR